MHESHLIAKRLAFVTDCVAEIRTLGKPAALTEDKVQQRFVEHTLQIAVQAMIDVAFAIASEHNLGEPAENRQAFDRLAEAGWITREQRDLCRRMVSFRNIVLHRYLQVDPRIVQQIVERHLGDLPGFVRAIRSRLG
ncbi:MAG: DUF86 domain-containing protein [Planctomycetes bacterium]|nr:DUF86 domain-containing protein [Planctomycetota bacterium]